MARGETTGAVGKVRGSRISTTTPPPALFYDTPPAVSFHQHSPILRPPRCIQTTGSYVGRGGVTAGPPQRDGNDDGTDEGDGGAGDGRRGARGGPDARPGDGCDGCDDPGG